jgi:hypothetical protein
VSDAKGRLVGRVAALNRYPVKSMAGERLAEAEFRWTGMRGDREYGFVLADRPNRFPWFTGRDLSEMVLHRPVAGAYAAAGLPVRVIAPDGAEQAIEDADLADRLGVAVGRPVRLVQLSRGTYDAMPVSVVSTASFAAVDAAHGGPVDPDRFRINVVVDGPERDTEWRGHALAFGSDGPVLAVTRPIARCTMITIDPRTGKRDAGVMRTVARAFDNELGEYASVLRPGTLRVGDEVTAAPLSIAAPAASG